MPGSCMELFAPARAKPFHPPAVKGEIVISVQGTNLQIRVSFLFSGLDFSASFFKPRFFRIIHRVMALFIFRGWAELPPQSLSLEKKGLGLTPKKKQAKQKFCIFYLFDKPWMGGVALQVTLS